MKAQRIPNWWWPQPERKRSKIAKGFARGVAIGVGLVMLACSIAASCGGAVA